MDLNPSRVDGPQNLDVIVILAFLIAVLAFLIEIRT